MLLINLYANLQPIVIFIGIMTIFCNFWTYKYNLLKRSKRPHPFGKDLNSSIGKFIINISTFVFSLGCALVDYLIYNNILTTVYV